MTKPALSPAAVLAATALSPAAVLAATALSPAVLITGAAAHRSLQNVTHRDLKLENLVLKRKGDLGSPVIVDFGLAKAARARDKMEVCAAL